MESFGSGDEPCDSAMSAAVSVVISTLATLNSINKGVGVYDVNVEKQGNPIFGYYWRYSVSTYYPSLQPTTIEYNMDSQSNKKYITNAMTARNIIFNSNMDKYNVQ